jgi:putative glutamine amidotransferase
VSFLREDKLGAYVEAVRAAGLEPVPISPAQRLGLEDIGGLVLTGGGDLDPSLYGAEPHAQTKHVFRERDELERDLIEEAKRKDLPILGICRGLQMLNVVRGGTLRQHIEGHKEVEHRVRTEPESKIAACVGTEDYAVNSRHHQCIDRVGSELKVTARAEDGIIEAVEDPNRSFVVGVQWHPERTYQEDAFSRRMFEEFVAEARRWHKQFAAKKNDFEAVR